VNEDRTCLVQFDGPRHVQFSRQLPGRLPVIYQLPDIEHIQSKWTELSEIECVAVVLEMERKNRMNSHENNPVLSDADFYADSKGGASLVGVMVVGLMFALFGFMVGFCFGAMR
jgi:hypothetical protein